MDGGAWWAAVHGVARSQTRLTDFTFTFHFHALEKEMATHSSVLAWRIPGTGEPGGLPSMGSHRVRDDWSDLAAAAAAGQLGNQINIRIILEESSLRIGVSERHVHYVWKRCIYPANNKNICLADRMPAGLRPSAKITLPLICFH